MMLTYCIVVVCTTSADCEGLTDTPVCKEVVSGGVRTCQALDTCAEICSSLGFCDFANTCHIGWSTIVQETPNYPVFQSPVSPHLIVYLSLSQWFARRSPLVVQSSVRIISPATTTVHHCNSVTPPAPAKRVCTILGYLKLGYRKLFLCCFVLMDLFCLALFNLFQLYWLILIWLSSLLLLLLLLVLFLLRLSLYLSRCYAIHIIILFL